MSASVRQRLLDLRLARGEDYNALLTQYSIERFLYRLSKSRLCDRFVLKGAMLFRVWSGALHRPTKDLDLLGHGDSTPSAVAESVRRVITTRVKDDGLVFDPATSLYYHRHRVYHPQLGRFVSRDPIGVEAGDSNVYRYVRNRPVSRRDPTGLIDPIDVTPGPGWDLSPCHSSAYYVSWIAMEYAKIGIGGALFTPFPAYTSMPFQHCMWNCYMAGTIGKRAAEVASARKEQADVNICKRGHSISDACWDQLSKKMRHNFASHCCSANQLSDWEDNETGRECDCAESYWTTTTVACKKCCTKEGVGPDTHDGPNDPERPCGPYFNERDEEAYDENIAYPPGWENSVV
ncbi:MAG: nucleotidyl transferase AbiEii/AbiGii toxin family protein [Planctomycetota bacterium]